MPQGTILAILAHPDDETLGFGGTLARYADAGAATHVITATRGEYGWFEAPEDYPGPEALGKIREKELEAAAGILKLRDFRLLDYIDGQLNQAESGRIIKQIVDEIRRIRPDVVLTFDPFGAYGHPDHIAISQFSLAAMMAAADSHYGEAEAHRVSKFYYRTWSYAEGSTYESAFGKLVMHVDGVDRQMVAWPEWAYSTVIDTRAYVEQVWDAVKCHRSQLPGYEKLLALPLEQQQNIFGVQTYYRAMTQVNGGSGSENDLFAGLETALEGESL